MSQVPLLASSLFWTWPTVQKPEGKQKQSISSWFENLFNWKEGDDESEFYLTRPSFVKEKTKPSSSSLTKPLCSYYLGFMFSLSSILWALTFYIRRKNWFNRFSLLHVVVGAVERVALVIRNQPILELLPAIYLFYTCRLGLSQTFVHPGSSVISSLRWSWSSGGPVEWSLFALFALPRTISLFHKQCSHSSQVNTAISYVITLFIVLFCCLPLSWLVRLSDWASWLFLLRELPRFYRSKWLGIGLAGCFLLSVVMQPTFLSPRWSENILGKTDVLSLSLLACWNSTAFLAELAVVLVRFLASKSAQLASLFGYHFNSEPRVVCTDVSDTSFCLSWSFPNDVKGRQSFFWPTSCTSSVADYYSIEINGRFIGETRRKSLIVNDLSPFTSYRVRVFAVRDENWIASTTLYARTSLLPNKVAAPNHKLSHSSSSGKLLTHSCDEKEILQLESALSRSKQERMEVEQQLSICQAGFEKELETVNQDLNAVLTKLQSLKDETEDECVKSRADLKALEDTKSGVDSERIFLQKTASSLKKEYDELVESIEQRRDDIETFKVDTRRLQSEIIEIREENERKMSQLNEDFLRLTGITDELSTAIERKVTEKKRLKSDLDNRKRKHDELVGKKEAQEHQIARIRADRSSIVTKLADLESKHQRAMEDIDWIQRKIRQNAIQKQRSQFEREASKRHLNQMNSVTSYSTLIDPHEESIDDLLDAVNFDRLNNECGLDGKSDSVEERLHQSFYNTMPQAEANRYGESAFNKQLTPFHNEDFFASSFFTPAPFQVNTDTRNTSSNNIPPLTPKRSRLLGFPTSGARKLIPADSKSSQQMNNQFGSTNGSKAWLVENPQDLFNHST